VRTGHAGDLDAGEPSPQRRDDVRGVHVARQLAGAQHHAAR
jgi:hypothetical protein